MGPTPPSMATPMPLKMDFGGEAARAHPHSVQPVGQPVGQPIAMNGSVAGGLGVASGASSAFSSPLPMEDEELRAHEAKFGYYGHDFPRQHPGTSLCAPALTAFILFIFISESFYNRFYLVLCYRSYLNDCNFMLCLCLFPFAARPPMEPVAHNHTYHLPSPLESTGAIQRPLQRDKTKCRDCK